MNTIRLLRTVRDVQREASARGYRGNMFSKFNDIPLVGTLRKQMQIAAIGCDSSPGPMSTRDRELHNRLVRAVVLTDNAGSKNCNLPQQVPSRPTEPTADYAIARAWQRRGM